MESTGLSKNILKIFILFFAYLLVWTTLSPALHAREEGSAKMQEALSYLEKARYQLKVTKHRSGEHGEEALEYVERAIREVKRAMKYRNDNQTGIGIIR